MRKTAGILALLILYIISSYGPIHAAAQQGAAERPSFPCAQTKTSTEKLICSDPELSSLDLEYSHLYNEGLKGKEKLAVDYLSYNEPFFLKQRDSCAEGILVPEQLRVQEIECLASWYYQRIATLSDLSSMSASEWSPRLVGGSEIYSRDSNGSERKRIAKVGHDIYFKTPGIDRLFKASEVWGQPLWPARIDRSIQFDVYKNVLGNLTLVEEYHGEDGNPRMQYFFNKDGRLSAQSRRVRARSDEHVYDQYDLIFYNAQGQEAQRTQLAYADRKISPVRTDPAGASGARPAFVSFTTLFDAKFKVAAPLDVDNLGICYVDLSDGYGSIPRVLNFQSQPLEFYKRSIPKMNYRGLDDIQTNNPTLGIETLVGTLRGKKIYSIAYPDRPVGVFVEREANQFLPLLYVAPEKPISILSVIKIDGEDVLTYSAPVGRLTNDYDFVLDRGVPRSLNYSALLVEEQKRILPESYSIRKLEGYDRATLTFRFSIEKFDAGKCCSSGGNLEIMLGIRDRRPYVKSSRWEKPE